MKRLILCLLLLLGLITVTAGAPALASSNDQLFAGCNQVQDNLVCNDKNTTTNPASRIIKDATDIVALLTGIAAVIIIIIGGLTMATSGGNSEAISNSRKRIVAAVVGLVIVALAWTLITFLTDKLIKT